MLLLNYTCWCNIHFHGITGPILSKTVKKSEFLLSPFSPSSLPKELYSDLDSSTPIPLHPILSKCSVLEDSLPPLIQTHFSECPKWLQEYDSNYLSEKPTSRLSCPAPKSQPKLMSLFNIISPH